MFFWKKMPGNSKCRHPPNGQTPSQSQIPGNVAFVQYTINPVLSPLSDSQLTSAWSPIIDSGLLVLLQLFLFLGNSIVEVAESHLEKIELYFRIQDYPLTFHCKQIIKTKQNRKKLLFLRRFSFYFPNQMSFRDFKPFLHFCIQSKLSQVVGDFSKGLVRFQ